MIARAVVRTSMPPEALPAWVPCGGFAGLVAYALDRSGPSDGGRRDGGDRAERGRPGRARRGAARWRVASLCAIVLDLPVNEYTVARLREDTGIELRDISAMRGRNGASRAAARVLGRRDAQPAIRPPEHVGEPAAQAAVGRVHRVRRLGDRPPRHGDAVDRHEHRRDLQPAVAARRSARAASTGDRRPC